MSGVSSQFPQIGSDLSGFMANVQPFLDGADHIVTTAFEGEVEVTRLFKYGEDFFIGDIVQIANEYGNEGSAYISELVISNSEEGLSIYPTFKTISK